MLELWKEGTRTVIRSWPAWMYMAQPKRTVLVVEDCADDAALIRIAFRKLGFSDLFQSVINVEQAIHYLKGTQADPGKFPAANLVLLDHQMPGDGIEIIKWIRN